MLETDVILEIEMIRNSNAHKYIVVLNYNGWKDTIECLESLLKLNTTNVHIIICDNASTNNSVEKIIAWADGKVECEFTGDSSLSPLVYPLMQKPVSIRKIAYKSGQGFQGDENDGSPLVLIQIDKNLGFSAGNNVGIRYALQDYKCSYIWILNNDTLVKADTLNQLIKKAEENDKTGIVGSVSCDYHQSSIIQNVCKGLNKNNMRAYPIGRGGSIYDVDQIDISNMYIYDGASFLVTRDFLSNVGLMNEKQFLYYEEQNYAERARRAGYLVNIAKHSIFYHKESMSTTKKGSEFMNYHYLRSMMIYLKEFYPNKLIKIFLYQFCRGCYQIMRMRFPLGKAILNGIFDGVKI